MRPNHAFSITDPGRIATTLCFILAGVWLLLRFGPYAPTRIEIAYLQEHTASWELYVTAAGGTEPVKYRVPVPAADAPARRRITVPGRRVAQVRLDIPPSAGTVRLKTLTWRHAGQARTWNQPSFHEAFLFGGFQDLREEILDGERWLAIEPGGHVLISYRQPDPPFSPRRGAAWWTWLAVLLACTGVLWIGYPWLRHELPTLFQRLTSRLADPRRAFLLTAGIFGLAYLFVTPPFQVPDENVHYYRSALLAQGRLQAVWGRSDVRRWTGEHPGARQGVRGKKTWTHDYQGPVPGGPVALQAWDMVETLLGDMPFKRHHKVRPDRFVEHWRLLRAEQPETFVWLYAGALYSPLLHAPQTLALAAGRLVNLGHLSVFYLGRMAGLVAWLLMVYGALSLLPVFKRLLMLVATLPMMLFLAPSFSADVMTNGVIFLGLAWILYVRARGRVSAGDYTGIGFLMLAVAVSKSVYFPLLGLLMLVPPASPGERTRHIAILGGIILAALAAAAAWNAAIRDFIPFTQINAPELIEAKKNTLLQAPWHAAVVMCETLRVHAGYYYQSFIGVLGWLDTYLPAPVYWAYGAILAYYVLREARAEIGITGVQKIVILAAAAIPAGLLLIAQWIMSTPEGESVIQGAQGRYFIPLVPVAALLLVHRRLRLPGGPTTDALITVSVWIMHAVALLALWERFYGQTPVL